MSARQSSINKPYVRIVEQPASRSIRFRYECEGRSAPIPGTTTNRQKKTYPTIQVMNYTGRAIVVTSCVTCTEPYK